MGPSLRSEREGLNAAKWVSLKIGYRFRTKVDFSSFVEMKIQGIHQRDEPNQSNHHFWWWRILHIYFIFGVDPHFDGLNANFSDPDHILAYSPSFSETQLHFFFLRLQLSVDVDWSSSTANFCASEHGLSVLLGILMIDQCISGTILSDKPKWDPLQSSQLWVGI